MIAPVTAVIGMDIHFYEKLPTLFPHADAKAWFKDLPENVLEHIALRNSSLQGAYFMLAAPALGLDCGPMSGFNNQKVDEAFSRKRPSNPISSAISVMEMPANSFRAHRA